jgi:AmmeMemoRadiSam system protein A
VGYSSFAFFYNDGERILNKKSQEVLLGIARKTLEEYVTRESIPRFDVKDKELLEKRGAFVTLKKRGELRGCIGYIQPLLPLYKAVVDMTVAAASKDMRFIPVHKGELRDIKIEISVLTPLRRITRLEEIEVGRHGIYIKKGDNSGLLLPQVATEYNWDREEFLRQTCIKAGLYRNAWKDKKTEIYTFTAQVISE